MKPHTNQPTPKAVLTTYERHGKDFYKRIGRIGGQNSHLGGFQEGAPITKEAGRKGGLRSRRTFHYQYNFTQKTACDIDHLLKITADEKDFPYYLKLVSAFGIYTVKYTLQEDFYQQTLSHRIHPLISLPMNLDVPIFYKNLLDDSVSVILCHSGKLITPTGKLRDLGTLKGYHVYGWSEYYQGVRIINKERL